MIPFKVSRVFLTLILISGSYVTLCDEVQVVYPMVFTPSTKLLTTSFSQTQTYITPSSSIPSNPSITPYPSSSLQSRLKSITAEPEGYPSRQEAIHLSDSQQDPTLLDQSFIEVASSQPQSKPASIHPFTQLENSVSLQDEPVFDNFAKEELAVEEKIDNTDNIIEVEEEETSTLTSRKSRQRISKPNSSRPSYEEQLKARLNRQREKARSKLALSKLTGGPNIKKRSFNKKQTTSSGGRTRLPRARNFRTFLDEENEEEPKEEEEEDKKAGRGFGSRSRHRPSRHRSRSRTSQTKNNIRDAIREQSNSRETPKFTPSKPTRDRFTPRSNQDHSQTIDPTPVSSINIQPSSTKSVSQKSTNTNAPKIVFKKFNRFDRPNRKALLRSKLFGIRSGLRRPGTIVDKEENVKKEEEDEIEKKSNEDNEEVEEDNESSPSALMITTVDDEDILQNLDNEEARLQRLQTTLTVSTMLQDESSEEFLEVVTIRSPYTFSVPDNGKSTRFITVTRTNTKTPEINPSHSLTSSFLSSSSIQPSSVLKHTPLFDTKSIPAPENILATQERDLIIEGSTDIEILSPLVLSSSQHHATPPLKTVTESFTTDKVIIKKSILPVVKGTDTSFITLSQTYSITKYVTAIKTIPPMDIYEFSPEQNFADFDNLFEEAGSERRESLLPGELEFSDQDNFGLEGPTPVRVQPPEGFLGQLDAEKLKLLQNHAPSIESSFTPVTSPPPTTTQPPLQGPGLDLASLGGLGITPEQLLYLQLLQNPLAALGLGGALGKQVVTESSPLYKTEPIVESSVIQLFLGAKEFFTTLTSTVGFTTKTDFVYSTRTLSGGGLNALGGLQQEQVRQEAQVPQQQGLGGLLGQQYQIITSPVTRETVITETHTEEYQILFRNRPTLTTLTSTELVTTQVVSFVTQTVASNPLAGLLG